MQMSACTCSTWALLALVKERVNDSNSAENKLTITNSKFKKIALQRA